MYLIYVVKNHALEGQCGHYNHVFLYLNIFVSIYFSNTFK